MRIALFIVLALSFLLGSRESFAEEPLNHPLPVLLGQADLEQLFLTTLSQDSPFPKEDLQVLNFKAKPENLRLPAGTLSHRIIRPGNTKSLGQKTLTVALLVNGQEIGQVAMIGDLALFGEVVSLATPLPRETVLAEGDLLVSRRNLGMLGEGVIRRPEDAVGKQLQSSLQAGSLLYDKLLKTPPLVKRGDRVTIRAKSAHLQVNVNGEVQNTGGKGEQVRVKNLMSRKELYARVVTPTVVEVEF